MPLEALVHVSTQKLDFIDRMRGLAILMVIALHFTQVFATPEIRHLFAFGQVGVQMFFVASAFTLCLSADNRRAEAQPLRNFFLRRLLRIAPLYWLGIAIYSAMFIHDGEGAAYTPANILANVLLIHGLVPAANNSIVPGGWTIGAEVLFYLLFPWGYAALARGWRKYGTRALAAAFAVSLAVSLAWQGWFRLWSGHWLVNNGFAYCALPTQLPVFVLGIAWYLAVWRGDHFAPVLRRDLPGGVILLLACAGIIGFELVPLNGLLPVLAGAAALLLGNGLRGGLLCWSWLGEVGKVSYSLYILHFAVVWRLSAWVLHWAARSEVAEWAILVPLYAADVVLLCLAGRITRRWIEEPASRWAGARILRREERCKSAVSATG